MITLADSAWLGYQVRMRQRLDLENLNPELRNVLKAIYQDGWLDGQREKESAND